MASNTKSKNILLKEIEELKKLNAGLEKQLYGSKASKDKTAFFKKCFDKTPIPVSIINKNGKTEFINLIFRKLFGYNIKDIPDIEAWFRKAYPDKVYRKKVQSSWRKATNASKEINDDSYVFKVTCKSGKVKDIVFRFAELDEERLILILEDISERVEVEQAFRESEKKFKRILDDISLAALMIDKKGTILYANKYLMKLTGWKQNDLIGKNWFSRFIPQNEKSNLKKSIAESSSNKNMTYIENYVLTKSGGKKFVAWNNLYFRNEDDSLDFTVSLGQNITEKKIAENEFKIRDDRFNTFIKNTGDAVNCYEFDFKFKINAPLKKQIQNIFDGRLVECNLHFAKVYGFKSTKEVLGKKFRELVQNDNKSIENLFKKFINNNYKIENHESIEFLNDGSKKYFLNNAHGTIEKGYLKRIWVIIKDITEIKKAEEALIESEKRFKGLFENATVGIYRTSVDGKVLMANPALVKMQGFSSFKDMSGINIAEQGYVNTEDKNYFRRVMKKFGEIKGFECEWWKKDGTKIYIRESATAIKNSLNEIIYYEGIVEDISDKKKAEEELLKNELRYRTLFSLSPSGIILSDLKGNILAANPAFCNSMGYTPNEIIGKNVSLIAAPENQNDIKNNIALLNKGKVLKHTVYDITKEGAYRYVELHETKIPLTEKEYGILTITNDITERKNFEEELIVAKEKAEKSDRLKSEFLAQISHEIRTPINSILSFTSYLQDELKNNYTNDTDDIFKIINQAGLRITRTIDMILNMSELQTGSYEPNHKKIDLYGKILLPVSAAFKKHSKCDKIKFSIDKNSDNCFVTGDEYTLNQIFENLINNAFKYTNTGKIKVFLGRDKKNKLYAKVSDTGIGISEEFLDIIFEPFSQEEQGYTRKFEGNGLGLALVKKYCDLNNASINVKSKKGKGTTFKIVFEN